MTTTQSSLFSEIENVIKNLNIESLSAERIEILQPLSDFIQSKVINKQVIRLNLICTHNSRRSHLSQVWEETASAYFNIKNIFCYSGGKEANAMFPMVAETLTRHGFQIKNIANVSNTVYTIKYSENEHPIIGLSKTYDDDFNTQSEFVAVMTCSQADGGCPFIAGDEKRVPITFEDPKAFDNTPQQGEKHEEKSVQIATEMISFSHKSNNNYVSK